MGDELVGPFTFDRPLSLTVELGPDFSLTYSENSDYLKGLMFWMERVLGCRKVSEDQVEISVTFNETLGFCRFNGRGFFDAWVVKVVAAASDIQAQKILDLAGAWHPARQYLGGSSAQGDGVALDEVSGVMKPVVFEFGFPALSPTGVMDAKKQHALLQGVWDGLETFVDGGGNACVRGAAVDEWVDVWSADQEYGECADQVSSQFKHSACGPWSDAGTIAVGFLGIMGQFDTLLMHCIDQRAEGSEQFKFQDVAGDDAVESVAWLPFGIEGGYGKLSRCRPVWLRPGLPVLAWFTAMALTALLTLLSCCTGCCCRCCRRKQGTEEESRTSDQNLTLALQSAASKKALDGISAAPFGKLLAGMVAEALGDESLEVPVRYEHVVGYSGWGLAKVGGRFSYHRLQHDGLGRGQTVQWWETEEKFVKWLQEQSDRTLAVHGFTEEELRRSDLIGKKTVTREQLLEMLDAAGKFPQIEETVGVGETTVDCLGADLRFTVRLAYRGSPSFLSSVVDDAPRPSQYEDVGSWLKEVAAHVRRYLAVLAGTHARVQSDRLRRQLEHEAEALMASLERHQASEAPGERARATTRLRLPTREASDTERKACYNVWRRACEGAHKWQGMHGLGGSLEYEDDSFQRYVAEALLLRLLESVGEHMIHAPEWIACVYQKALGSLKMTPASGDEPCSFSVDIDYTDLCEPLQQFCQNSNVFAKRQGINFDDMNDHGLKNPGDPQPLGLTKTFREPAGPLVLCNTVVNYQWPLSMVLWLFAIALYLRDVDSDFSGRVAVTGDRRFSGFVVLLVDLAFQCVVNCCWLFVSTPVSSANIKHSVLGFQRVGSFCRLIVLVPITLVVFWVEGDLQALDDLAGLEDVLGMSSQSARTDFWFVPYAYLLLRFAFGLLPKHGLGERLRFNDSADQKGHHKRIGFFWVVFGLICFVSYYGVLTGMARSLTPKGMCQLGDNDDDFCEDRQLILGSGLPSIMWKDTQCVACMTSVVSSWLLAAIGSFLIPYFIFNCCVAFMGSSLGVSRGLVETNISSLDFSVYSLSSEFDRQRKSEAGWVSHGTVLHAIYGKDWKKVWAVMVEGLFDDCLVNQPVRDKLLAAASSGGMAELKDSESLRILPQAMQRIGYLFASHREILSNRRISFAPYCGNDRDVHCDALGITHPGRIPSLTQIIPVYSEDGIMSIKELLGKPAGGSVATTLEFLVSQFPDEWKIFAETVRLHPTELYDRLAGGRCTPQQQDQVREWASHRAQSVIRTVNGAVHYHRALHLLLNRGEGVGFEDVRRRVQLILAHQTYGKVSMSKASKATLRSGMLTFKGAHGLKAGDTVRLSLQARSTMDLTGGLVFKKAVDKFKDNLRPKAPAPGDDGAEALPTLLGRAMAGSRERPNCLVFSLTIVNVDHAKLVADKAALKSLEAAVKEAVVDESAGAVGLEDVTLTTSAVEGAGSAGGDLLGILGWTQEDFEPAISVECTITPPPSTIVAHLEGQLGSSSTLKYTLIAAIEAAGGLHQVAEGEVRLGGVGAVSRTGPAGGAEADFKDFVSGAFYTVGSVLEDQRVTLVGCSANGGQVMCEKVEANKRDQDLHYMLSKHKGYPFFVAIDFQRGKTHPRLEELIDQHVRGSSKDEGVMFKYASVLIKYRYFRVGGRDERQQDDWPVEVVHVLPRARGLLIGSEGNLTQGKSGNQLGALRFAEGHFLQMMDANMGCYSGESFKVPVVLQGFYPKPTAGSSEHRLALRARIIGFREHIFTRSHGLVGTIMADSEWTFGTLVQRLLGFLNVRMHYGHPDFMDCFWASNRGSVSKASPHINLSEDIFAGLNVNARDERSLHTDILEWEKGREVQFCAGSGFFWKISSGSVGLMRTRDLRSLCGRASIMQSVALYFATVAWYVHNILVDYGTELYVLLFVFMTFASKSLNDLGALGSALAVEWFITPALSATLPAVIGFGVEYGPMWLVTQYLPTVPASMMYFIFINKSMASSVRSTIWANTAEYVNTGRPHANKSYSMKEAFVQFRASHYVPAVTLLYLVIVYSISNIGGALPMVMIVLTAVCWIVAPVLFRPPTGGVWPQFAELGHFILCAPPSSRHLLPGKATTLYELALDLELKKAHRSPGTQLLGALALSLLYVFMCVTTIWEQMPAPLFAWAITFCVKAVWRLSGMKQAGLVNIVFLLLLPVVLFFSGSLIENFGFSSLLLSMIIFTHIMHTVKVFWWFVARLVLPKGSPLGYDRVVHLLYDFGLGYQLQVYAAIVVLAMQALCELLLWLLDLPYLRLRTWALLNRRVSEGCVARMYGSAPAEAAPIAI